MEELNLKFEFSAKFAKEPPQFSIYNNNELIYPETTVTNKHTAELSVTVKDQPNNRFIIQRSNHDQQTDQQLILESLYVDGIDLETILIKGRYYPIYPEPWYSEQIAAKITLPEYQTGALIWGWNGRWELEYTVPFYTWMLKNV